MRPGALLRVLGARIRRGRAEGERLQQRPAWARSGALVRDKRKAPCVTPNKALALSGMAQGASRKGVGRRPDI